MSYPMRRMVTEDRFHKAFTMTISDRDRKILWARSGNKCSICKAALVVERTANDPAAIVGDEAHIVARSAGGPRAGLLEESALDAYENLILLCKVDHKTVDDQPNEYTIDRLHAIKSQHEAWVRQTLGREGLSPDTDLWSRAAPIRLVTDPSSGPIQLVPFSAPCLGRAERRWCAGRVLWPENLVAQGLQRSGRSGCRVEV